MSAYQLWLCPRVLVMQNGLAYVSGYKGENIAAPLPLRRPQRWSLMGHLCCWSRMASVLTVTG